MNNYGLEIIEKLRECKEIVITHAAYFLLLASGDESHEPSDEFLDLLAMLPVSKKNVFYESLWDFCDDYPNRAASVSDTKLKLDFIKYNHLPAGVIIEFKCLFLAVYWASNIYRLGRATSKANTVITYFNNGLMFFNQVYADLESEYGGEFIKKKMNSLNNLNKQDLINTTHNYKYKFDSFHMKVFFSFITNLHSKQKLGIECDVDYEMMLQEYLTVQSEVSSVKNKNANQVKIKPYFDNHTFEKILTDSAFYVIRFLKLMGEKVHDDIMLEHYKILAVKYAPTDLSKEAFDDYGVVQLARAGYSYDYIFSQFPDSLVIRDIRGRKYKDKKLGIIANKLFLKNHSNSTFVSKEIKKCLASARMIIGLLTGARPNVLGDFYVGCLKGEDGCFDLYSEEHKRRKENWNLFNDKWIATPIMRDAMSVISIIYKSQQNKYVFENSTTTRPNAENTRPISLGFMVRLGYEAITGESVKDLNCKVNAYTFRHSLAYQLFRADVGLPVISYQLKHLVSATDELYRKGKVSEVTLGYGGIANQLAFSATEKKPSASNRVMNQIQHDAEKEAIKVKFDPDGVYIGGKAKEHKERVTRYFNGCAESGYGKEETFEAMAKQGLAIFNVGLGFCFGDVVEEFDESLPCIGGLRCNPNRCSNAIVTKANAPKWRDVYLSNLRLIDHPDHLDNQSEIIAAVNEAKNVLKYLGEELIL